MIWHRFSTVEYRFENNNWPSDPRTKNARMLHILRCRRYSPDRARFQSYRSGNREREATDARLALTVSSHQSAVPVIR